MAWYHPPGRGGEKDFSAGELDFTITVRRCTISDNGTVGLWNSATGRQLMQLRLHGPARQLAFHGGRLHALTELGDYASMDLSIFSQDYCGLLREVWEQAPVSWEGSQAVLRPPPADHRCSEPGPEDRSLGGPSGP